MYTVLMARLRSEFAMAVLVITPTKENASACRAWNVSLSIEETRNPRIRSSGSVSAYNQSPAASTAVMPGTVVIMSATSWPLSMASPGNRAV